MNPTVSSLPKQLVSDFIETAHEISRRNLVECSSGNLSVRLDEEYLLIKSSRAWLERLQPSDLTLCRLSDGQAVDGPNPSVEIGFHTGIMKVRFDAKTVLHFQSPFATAITCRSDLHTLNFNVTPEVPFYIGAVGWVPFHMPGSPELAHAVSESARSHALILLQNHGLVTFGDTFDEMIQRAVFFEMTAKIILLDGAKLKPLLPEHSRRLMELRNRKTV